MLLLARRVRMLASWSDSVRGVGRAEEGEAASVEGRAGEGVRRGGEEGWGGRGTDLGWRREGRRGWRRGGGRRLW